MNNNIMLQHVGTLWTIFLLISTRYHMLEEITYIEVFGKYKCTYWKELDGRALSAEPVKGPDTHAYWLDSMFVLASVEY